MTKILFVCLGNICRSPMAEGLLRKRIAIEGREAEFFVDSAATSTYEVGKTPHPGTKKILNQENVEELKRRAPRSAQEKIHLFLSSIPGKEKENVPDPYYTNNFDETYQLITEGLDHWWNIWMDENKITNSL